MDIVWRTKRGSRESGNVRVLPKIKIHPGSDPLSKSLSTKNKSSKVSISQFSDPLQLFAHGEETEELPSSSQEQQYAEDSWMIIMKPRGNPNYEISKDVIRPPPGLFSSSIREMIETFLLTKEAALSNIERLEKSLSSDARKQKINDYCEFGLPGEFLVPLVGVLQSSVDQLWQEDQRRSACDLVVEVAEMLNDYKDPIFYHHKFYHLSDIIYQFGRTTYSQLLSKNPGIRINFSHQDVCKTTQEEAHRKLDKVRALPQLLPRLYLEASLLKCYRLVEEGDVSDILQRLILSIGGITDPLVNVYFRCFLCRVLQTSSLPIKLLQRFGMLNWKEMVGLIHQSSGHLEPRIFEVPIRCLLGGTLLCERDTALRRHFKDLNVERKTCGVILKSLIDTSDPALISEIVLETLVPLIGKSRDFPHGLLVLSLGQKLLQAPIAYPHQVLKSVWSIAGSISDTDLYIEVCLVWIEFVCKYSEYSAKDLNRLFGDILLHLENKSKGGIVRKAFFLKVLQHESLTYPFLLMPNFLPAFGSLQDEHQVALAKRILERLFNYESMKDPDDPIGISVLLHLCQILTDSISPFTAQDEIRQISALICSFIRFADSQKRSLEKRLSFYSDLRRKFVCMEMVQYELVTTVNVLSYTLHANLSGGKHTSKTKGFAQALIAFAFITIPSLRDPVSRIYAFTHTAQVSLLNQSIGQAEACLREGIKAIPTDKNSDYHSDAINNLLSTILLLPGEDLSIIRLAVDRLTQFDRHLEICINALRLLSMTVKDAYPYAIDGLDSNDSLYCGQRDILCDMCNELSNYIIHCILLMAQEKTKNFEREVHYKLFYVMLLHCEMPSEEAASLCFKLWKSASKSELGWIVKSRKELLKTASISRERSDELDFLYECIIEYENKVKSAL